MPSIYPGPMGAAPAIPVRDAAGKPLPLDVVKAYLMVAVQRARSDPDRLYHVQRDGWGYAFADLRPVFKAGPGNLMMPYGEH